MKTNASPTLKINYSRKSNILYLHLPKNQYHVYFGACRSIFHHRQQDHNATQIDCNSLIWSTQVLFSFMFLLVLFLLYFLLLLFLFLFHPCCCCRCMSYSNWSSSQQFCVFSLSLSISPSSSVSWIHPFSTVIHSLSFSLPLFIFFYFLLYLPLSLSLSLEISCPIFWCCGSLFLNGFLGMEIWHVGQNAMFVFWRQEEGKNEGSWPLVHPLCIWVGWLGGILEHNLVLEPKKKLFILLFKVV